MEIVTNYKYTNGSQILYFDDAISLENYLLSLPSLWDKQAHIAEINALHEAEFEKRVLNAGYKQDLKEFERTLADTRSQWHEEAKAINTYWLNGEITIDNYAETVTEETAQDPIVFVSSI
jgi:hypothetical protein